MKSSIFAAALAALSLCGSGYAQPYGAGDPWMGVYEGTWTAHEGRGKFTSQIRAFGDGAYEGFLLLDGDGKTVSVIKFAGEMKEGDGAVLLKGGASAKDAATRMEANGRLAKQKDDAVLSGRFDGALGAGEFQGKKIVRKPPTLGAKPPANAVVMFDGSETNKWQNFHFRLMDDGSMQVQKGNMETQEKMSDFELHVEFRTPFMPKSQGQARGNSGVYLQSIYEVQVLDSFGLYPLAINDCGSIYGVKAAAGNACVPPMEWQTYDITYESGESPNPPTITVLHNGVKTIDAAKVPVDKVGKGGGGGSSNGGFLMLQDHGNPVQYRNIWARPLKK